MGSLVLSKLIVAMLAHEAFLKREMRGDRAEDLAKEGGHREFIAFRDDSLVKPVDELNQPAVFMIDGVDADAVAIFPFDQGHVRSLRVSERQSLRNRRGNRSRDARQGRS